MQNKDYADWIRKGVYYSYEMNEQMARACYKRAVAIDAKAFDAHFKLANELVNSRRKKQALDYFGIILGMQHISQIERLLCQACICELDEKFEQAKNCLKQVLELESNQFYAQFYYARLFLYDKQYDEAAKLFADCLPIAPYSTCHVYHAIGYCHKLAERLDDAKQYEHKALASYSRCMVALITLAELEQENEQLYILQAEKIAPWETYYKMGTVYYKREEYEKGEAMIKRCVRYIPHTMNIYELLSFSHLLRIYMQVANKVPEGSVQVSEEAMQTMQWLHTGLKRAQTDDDIKEIQKTMKSHTKSLSEYNALNAHVQQLIQVCTAITLPLHFCQFSSKMRAIKLYTDVKIVIQCTK